MNKLIIPGKIYKYDPYCKGIKKNGIKCGYQSVYMGYCRIHGKHIMKDEKDPFKIIQTGNYDLLKDRITKNKLDVNYVKDGKTVIHRLLLITEKKKKSIRAYCSLLAKNGLDINKCSTDSFRVGRIKYIDMEISPIIYLLFVSKLPLFRKRTIIKKLYGVMKDFNYDQSFHGKHILSLALDCKFYNEIIEKGIKYVKGEVLKQIRDSSGRDILRSFIYSSLVKTDERYSLPVKSHRFLAILLFNKTLTNIKDETGAIPCATMLKAIAPPDIKNTSTPKRIIVFGVSDVSIVDNFGISTLELPEYKYLGGKDVYSILKDLTETKGKSYSRHAIKSLLDIIFTIKLIVKRRKFGLCRLVGQEIVNHLLKLYMTK